CLPWDPHTAYNCISEECIQSHTWRKSDRIFGEDPHHQRTDDRCDRCRRDRRLEVQSCVTKDARVYCQYVCHGEERSETSHELSSVCSPMLAKFKITGQSSFSFTCVRQSAYLQ